MSLLAGGHDPEPQSSHCISRVCVCMVAQPIHYLKLIWCAYVYALGVCVYDESDTSAMLKYLDVLAKYADAEEDFAALEDELKIGRASCRERV